MQRGWKRLRRCAALAEPGDELLEEERVAAGRRGDPLALGRGQVSALDRVEELGHRRARERAELDEAVAAAEARLPAAMALVERVAPRRRDDERGRAAHPLGDVGEQLHERGLGQVRVVEHQHERSPPSESLDHAQEGPRRVLAGTALTQPHGGRHLAHGRRRNAQPCPDLVDRAIARDLLDDRAQRPVGHAAAVRRTAPGEDRGAVAQHDRQLGGQARLADPRLSDEGHHVRRRRGLAARVRVAQAPQLVVAPDERAVEPTADRRSVRVEALQPEAALAERRRARGVADDPPGRRVDADLLEGRRPAEPLRGADRLAEDRRRTTPRGRHDLARRDAAARAQPERQLPCARDELGGRPQGPLRGVLVGHRRAEDGEHGVAARLDDDAVVLGAHLCGVLVVALEHRPQRLGVGPGRVARVRQLREDARHQAPGLRR